MKFSEAIPQFGAWKKYDVKNSTAISYRIHLQHFALFMHNCDIRQVKFGDVISYLDGMNELGWDKNSFMVKCIALRKFFEFFTNQKLEVLDPQMIPIPDREYKFPNIATDNTYARIMAVIPDNNDPRHIRNKTMIGLLWDSGMRVGELVSMNVGHLDLGKMEAVIKTEKAKTLHPIRKVFWTIETNEYLKKWLVKRTTLTDQEALFISCAGIKTGDRLNSKGVEEVMRRLSKLAKLEKNANPHSFRHRFGRDLAIKQANNATISSLMGHASIQSSQVYTILNGSQMAEQYNKFKRK